MVSTAYFCYSIITHPPLSSSCRSTTRLPPFLCQTSRFRSCQKHLRPSTASKPSTTCTSVPSSWRHIADTYTQPNGPCAPAPTQSHSRCRGRRHRCHHPRRHHRRDHFRRDRRRDRPVRRQRLKAERPPGPQRSGHERVCLSSPPPHPNHTSLTRNRPTSIIEYRVSRANSFNESGDRTANPPASRNQSPLLTASGGPGPNRSTNLPGSTTTTPKQPSNLRATSTLNHSNDHLSPSYGTLLVGSPRDDASVKSAGSRGDVEGESRETDRLLGEPAEDGDAR